MVLEDYGELMFLQTVLKKIGFDVDAIQSSRSFNDNLLRMNPDLLVMTAHGKRVNGLELSHGVRRVRGLPRIILLKSLGSPVETDPLVEGWLESPVAATDFLDLIAEICELNKQVLHEKFQKLKLKEIEEEKARVLKLSDEQEETLDRRDQGSGNFGVLDPSTMPSDEREKRYQKFLLEAPPEQRGFSVKDVQSMVRELRQAEKPEDLEELERQRKAFVEYLFEKKKS